MRQGAEQDRVDHAEEGDVGSDAQGQGGHGDEGERRAGAKSPQRETEILPEGVHSSPLSLWCETLAPFGRLAGHGTPSYKRLV